MPHTGDILPGGRYAVVSCHVERPLDDEVWHEFSAIQERRPGGFRIAALMRPPDVDAGEDDRFWLERARAAATRGPLGLHTHWTAPDHARPTRGDPAERVRREGEWVAERGLEPTLFCGGGWYIDTEVAAAVAELGYADCTATAFTPSYLGDEDARLAAAEPVWVELPGRRRLLELPTTHSIGMLARGLLAPFPGPVVHAYFHDTDLLRPSRRLALLYGLRFLGLKRTASDLDELQRRFRPAKTMSFANSLG
jgi:hypothetical protein